MSGLCAILTAVLHGIRLAETLGRFPASFLSAYQLLVTQRPQVNAGCFFQVFPCICVEVEIAPLLYGLSAIRYVPAVFFATGEKAAFVDAAL